MEKIVDAHIHIRPEWLLGYQDRRMHISFGPYGRICDSNGVKQRYYMPEYIQATKVTAEALLEVMDRNHIEKGVIMHSLYHVMNWDVVSAVNRYPDRFAGAMVVEPGEKILAQVRKFHMVGLSALKFEMGSFPKIYPDFKFDDLNMYPVWEYAEENHLTVTIDTHPIGGPGYQVEALRKILRDFPGLNVIICHGGFPDDCVWNNASRYDRWHEMVDLAQNEHVYLEMSALVDLFGTDVYPYPNIMRLTEELIHRVGAKKLIWGTDIPGTFQRATYQQMFDMFDRSGLFSEEDKEFFFHRNAEKLYFQNRIEP